MSNSNATRYGQYYWCIVLDDEDSTEIYAHADEITYDDGNVTLWHHTEEGPATPTISIAKGHWKYTFAASCMDGHAVAAEHWKGQIA